MKREDIELELDRVQRDIHTQKGVLFGRRVTIREKKAEIKRLEADEASTAKAIETLEARERDLLEQQATLDD